MGFAELDVAIGKLGAYSFPHVKLRCGQSVGLVLPGGWSDEDTQRLWATLESTARAAKLRIARANTLVERKASWWEFLRGKSSAKAVADALRQPLDAGREFCRRCGVDPEPELAATPWVERKLLDFELAAESADLIVVDDVGMGIQNLKRFAEHVGNALRTRRFAVLVLMMPMVTLRAPGKTFHSESWADECLPVSREG